MDVAISGDAPQPSGRLPTPVAWPTISPGRRRAALTILAVSTCVVVTTETLPVGLLSLVGESLRVAPQEVGLLVTGYAFMVALSAAPLTAWTSHWPRRRLFLTVCAVFAAGAVLSGSATNYAVLLIARLLCGAAHGVFFSIAGGYAAALAGPERTGRAVVFIVAGNSVALVLGMPLGTALASLAGWRFAFYVVAGICIATLLVAFAVLPERPAQPTVRLVDLPRIARIPGLRPIVAATAFTCLAHFTVYTYATPVLQDAAGMSGRATDATFVLYGLAGLASTWIVGFIPNRYFRRCLFVAAGLHAAAFTSLAILVDIPPITAVAIATLSIAFTVLSICLQTALLTAADTHTDAANSLYVTTFNFGIGGGAIVGGVFLGHAGVDSLPYAALFFLAVAIAATWRARDPAAVPAAEK
jgi:predicted MFS family arabinose efflux permease